MCVANAGEHRGDMAIRSIECAACCSAAACRSVRFDRSILPAAISVDALWMEPEELTTVPMAARMRCTI